MKNKFVLRVYKTAFFLSLFYFSFLVSFAFFAGLYPSNVSASSKIEHQSFREISAINEKIDKKPTINSSSIVFKENNVSIEIEKLTEQIVKKQDEIKSKSVVDQKPAAPQIPKIVRAVVPEPLKATQNQPYLTISKIGLENIKLDYSSAIMIDNLDNKMLYTPIVESQLTPDLCSKQQNSYIYGHSEPVSATTAKHTGAAVFSKLDQLKAGDIIVVTNKTGQTCTYKVKFWEVARTDSSGSTTQETFMNAYYPNTHGESWLTIQTCKKSSSTERLLLRAVMVE